MKAQHQKNLFSSDFPINVFCTDVAEFPPHWHEAVEMVYVPDGWLRVGVNNEIYALGSGDILLITGSDVHYFVPEQKHVKRLIVHFDMAFFETVFPEAKNKRFSKIFFSKEDGFCDACHPGPDAKRVYRLLAGQFEEITREFADKSDAYRIVLGARIFDILAILFRHVPMQAYPLHERNRRLNRLERLQNVFDHVEKNYGSEITLKDISSVANFSEYYFARFFKETTGMTFGRYLNNYRVEKASRMLRSTDGTITEIAFRSGFGSIKTFNRVFRQIKGCSPTVYKKTIFEA